MTPTKEEREDAAYRLRQAAKWSYVWLNDQTMRELTGMEPSRLVGDSTLGECIDSTREIFRHLADLIDPDVDEDGDQR